MFEHKGSSIESTWCTQILQDRLLVPMRSSMTRMPEKLTSGTTGWTWTVLVSFTDQRLHASDVNREPWTRSPEWSLTDLEDELIGRNIHFDCTGRFVRNPTEGDGRYCKETKRVKRKIASTKKDRKVLQEVVESRNKPVSRWRPIRTLLPL